MLYSWWRRREEWLKSEYNRKNVYFIEQASNCSEGQGFMYDDYINKVKAKYNDEIKENHYYYSGIGAMCYQW